MPTFYALGSDCYLMFEKGGFSGVDAITLYDGDEALFSWPAAEDPYRELQRAARALRRLIQKQRK
jgi:hypothetical protein